MTEHLADPLRWKKPRRIFVNSMSDLFHEKLTNEQIAAIFGVMAACSQHTFQCLTKRAARMREWFEWADDATARSDWMHDPRRPNAAPAIHKVMEHLARAMPPSFMFQENVSNAWPLPNVWIGVSVENQDALSRLDDLRACPAAVRMVSFEPLLEDLGEVDLTGIGWSIVGCESGPGARPCDVAWLRSLRDQCAAADVPFFLKQATHSPITYGTGGVRLRNFEDITEGEGSHRRPGGVIELPYLDGIRHADFPVTPVMR